MLLRVAGLFFWVIASVVAIDFLYAEVGLWAAVLVGLISVSLLGVYQRRRKTLATRYANPS